MSVTTESGMDVVTLDELVTTHLNDERYSPYSIIKVVNTILTEAGVDRVLPSQMGYNYAKNGLFTGTKGQKVYTKDEVQKWMVKYLTKNLVK